MATIRAAIAMYDGVSRPLQAMSRGVNTLINAMEAAQGTFDHGFDPAVFQQVREDIADAVVGFNQLEQSIRDSENQQHRFNDSVRDGTNAADGLWQKVKGIAAAVGGIMGLNKVLGISDQLTSTTARLRNAQENFTIRDQTVPEVGIIDTAAAVTQFKNRSATVEYTDNNSIRELEQQVMASAQRSRSAYMDTAAAVAKMGMNARDAFSGMDEVIAFTELVNKSFVIGGASAQEQSAAMLQLTQAMASGVLRGEELNSIFENAPSIVQAIADHLGVSIGEIRTMAAEGQITADIVKNAMFDAADDIERKFENMPKTWGQRWTMMKNRALSIFSPILNKINELANNPVVDSVTNGVMDALAGVAQIGSVVLDVLVAIATAVVDNWSWISPIIYGVAGALAVYYGWQLAVNTIQAIGKGVHIAMAVAQMIHAAATGALTAATAADIAAQNGLNAAMYACPIVWIIMLIVALIAIFYAAVAAVNKFAGTSVSATGIICGVFMMALAFIGNILNAAWNLILDVFTMIHNLVAEVANFIGNVFNDPVGAICRLFFGLFDTVLEILEALASAIDTIFGSNFAGAVQGWRDSLGGWVDETFGQGMEIMAKTNADDIKLGRYEYGAAWNAGNEFGAGIEDSVSGLFDFSQFDPLGSGSDAFDLGTTLDGIYGNTGDSAANTAAMRDALDYAEEDLAYMRDIAEREAINRFTTAEIHVEQTNHNNISKDVDVDGIMDAWATDFAEKLEISEEGVHE